MSSWWLVHVHVLFCNLFSTDVHTRSWIINSITRLVAQLGYLPEVIHTQIALYLTSVDTDVQQVCLLAYNV